jgi:hypothetical protein
MIKNNQPHTIPHYKKGMTKSKQPKEQTTRLTAFRMPVSLYNNLKGGNLSQKIIKALELSISKN